jgi:hypothetical protein
MVEAANEKERRPTEVRISGTIRVLEMDERRFREG